MKIGAKVVKIYYINKLNFTIMKHFVYEKISTATSKLAAITSGEERHLIGLFYFIEKRELTARDGKTIRETTSKTLYNATEYNEELIQAMVDEYRNTYKTRGYTEVNYKKDNFVYVIK